MTVPLQPSSAGSSTNPGGGKLGVAGTDFVIYMWRHRFRYFSETFEKTGGGDALPVYANSGDLKGRIVISGIAVSNAAFGIANLLESDKNPVVDLDLILDGNRKHRITVFLEDIQGEWFRKSGYMPVTVTGYLHATTPSNIETTV